METMLQNVAKEKNNVLKNAFLGVSVELLVYCAGMFGAMAIGISNFWIPFIAAIVITFILPKFANSMTGFALANCMALLLGIAMAPAMSYYLSAGLSSLVLQAVAVTAITTMGLSFYAATTKKDFSFMGGFLFIGLISIIAISLLNIFIFKSSVIHLAISYAGVLIFSGYILYDVSNIVNNKQGNWILASVSMFLNIINLFWSILNIMGASND